MKYEVINRYKSGKKTDGSPLYVEKGSFVDMSEADAKALVAAECLKPFVVPAANADEPSFDSAQDEKPMKKGKK